MAIIPADGFTSDLNLNAPKTSNMETITLVTPTIVIVELLRPYSVNSSSIFSASPPLKIEGKLKRIVQALITVIEIKRENNLVAFFMIQNFLYPVKMFKSFIIQS